MLRFIRNRQAKNLALKNKKRATALRNFRKYINFALFDSCLNEAKLAIITYFIQIYFEFCAFTNKRMMGGGAKKLENIIGHSYKENK